MLIVLNVFVYAPVWHHEFVAYDDPGYLTENRNVYGGLTWRAVGWAFTADYFYNWHPVTWLSHMLDVQMYGLSPGPHHLTSLILHIANTILLFGLLRAMTGALGRSAFVAGLFAIHPLHVESVAWVSERKDVLSTLFWMLTLCGYLWYLRKPRLARYLVMLLLFVMGLMTKPMLVTLPFVLLLMDYWPLDRATLDWNQRANALRLVREKLPLFALAIASSIVTLVVQRRGGATVGLEALPLKFRLMNAVLAYVSYIGKMLWPARLAAIYPFHLSLHKWWAMAALLALVTASIMAIRAARRHPYIPVGWLWYLGTLVPVIGLVQVGNQSMADRYTYLPLIGIFIMVAWGVPELLSRWQYRSIALPAAATLAIAALAITARGQVRYWKNTNSLWDHALQVTSENYVVHNYLGAVLANQERVSDAIAEYVEALRINPGYPEAHNNLGAALARQGKMAEAVAEYGQALRLDPDYADAHKNLGLALISWGNLGQASAHFSQALRLKPDDVEAHYYIGVALMKEGKLSDAAANFSEALRVKADYAEAHYSLGITLEGEGNAGEAMAEYAEALRLKPDYAEAHNNLGAALARQGKISEANAQYSEALRLKPDLAEAHNNFGVALANQGKISEAIAQYMEALRINPDLIEVHKNLGAALAQQGKLGNSH